MSLVNLYEIYFCLLKTYFLFYLLKRNMCRVVQIIILANKAWMRLLANDKNNICWDVVWSLRRTILHSEMTNINLKHNEIMCSYMPGLPLLEM